MTQEDKELLLRDLCGRLPYGVKIELTWWVMGEGTCINTALEPDHIEQLLNDEDGDTEIKPYLRPMSSMTEEQEEEYNDLNSYELGCFPHTEDALDYLIKNYFDYRGLIPMGLAIDATNLNIYEQSNK